MWFRENWNDTIQKANPSFRRHEVTRASPQYISKKSRSCTWNTKMDYYKLRRWTKKRSCTSGTPVLCAKSRHIKITGTGTCHCTIRRTDMARKSQILKAKLPSWHGKSKFQWIYPSIFEVTKIHQLYTNKGSLMHSKQFFRHFHVHTFQQRFSPALAKPRNSPNWLFQTSWPL